MRNDDILSCKEFKACADFHGHICPGLAIGYRAAMAGLEWLKENRANDEELVAIVETDSCSTDAIQVLTGCTFGKGNLVYKDHGKQVFTFLDRTTGSGVRVSMKPDTIALTERHRELIQKIRADGASKSERKEFSDLHRRKSVEILEKPVAEIFTITAAQTTLPAKAEIEPSYPCERCGEPTMRSRLMVKDGHSICRDCLGDSPEQP